jgi:hypothetical protein
MCDSLFQCVKCVYDVMVMLWRNNNENNGVMKVMAINE